MNVEYNRIRVDRIIRRKEFSNVLSNKFLYTVLCVCGGSGGAVSAAEATAEEQSPLRLFARKKPSRQIAWVSSMDTSQTARSLVLASVHRTMLLSTGLRHGSTVRMRGQQRAKKKKKKKKKRGKWCLTPPTLHSSHTLRSFLHIARTSNTQRLRERQ